MPKVSVILRTSNDLDLQASLDSILTQTFKDYELLIVADAATEKFVVSIKESLTKKNVPSILLFNTYNIGNAACWNRALIRATGEYVLVQDANTISLPHRIETQVNFLDKHSMVDMVGSSAINLGKNYEVIGFSNHLPTCTDGMHKFINSQGFCPVLAPSIAYRRDVILGYGGYSESSYYPVFELVARLLSLNCNIANIPEPLVKYRIRHIVDKHTREISARFRRKNLMVPKLSFDRFLGPTFSEWRCA